MKLKTFTGIVILTLASMKAQAQLFVHSVTTDTSKHATITAEGYVDAYYTFDFNQPKDDNRPYFVSYSRHNEVNLNLAYLSLRFNSDRVRAVFTPGFGTYMNANYAAERVTLRNIVEANVGFKPFRDKGIWIDMGVIGSPYTNETALSLDQIMYTRSFASEYVPYYLAGARISIPLGSKFSTSLYVLNGWQEIEDVNAPLAFGSQLDYKPSDNFELDWDVFIGSEKSAALPNYGMRYFNDLYATWKTGKHLTTSACAYVGMNQIQDGSLENHYWWQANVAVRYAFNDVHSICMRVEHFDDPDQVLITSITGVNKFDCNSATLGYNISLTKQTQLRFEGRYFLSDYNVFIDHAVEKPTNTAFQTTIGLTSRF